MTNHSKDIVPLISIIVPVYCEEDIIEETLRTIQAYMNKETVTYEIIVVDDGSSDNTWQLVQALQKEILEIKALQFSRNFGKEAGILAGLRKASGQGMILMDGDLQHPPDLLTEMIKIWQTTDADVVETIKIRQKNEGIVRRAGAHVFYSFMYFMTDHDLARLSDYKLMDRKVVDALLELGEYNRFFRGLVAWLGFKHIEIAFTVPERGDGSSSWSLTALIKFAIQAITSFSARPLQLITMLGIGFFMLASLLALRVLYQLFAGTAVSGFATIILLQLLIGSIIMFGLGLIGLYIANIYDEVKRRPNYIVKNELQSHEHSKTQKQSADS